MAQAESLLFECDALHASYLALYPENSASYFRFSQFVPIPDPLFRLNTFESWLTPAERVFSRRFLTTIEKLREALVLSEQDVDYCFSFLPPAPKHKRLRELFDRYLASPLAKDLAADTWAWIEAIKESSLESPLKGEVVCIQASSHPSPLFAEVSRALSYVPDITAVRLSSAADYAFNDSQEKPGLLLRGANEVLLERLAARIARSLVRGESAKNILIPFSGEAHELSFLEFLLTHYRVPHSVSPFLRSATAQTLAAKHAFTWALRRDRDRPLSERLSLSQSLTQTHQPVDGMALSVQYYAPTPGTKGVQIVPFHPVRARQDKRLHEFVGAQFLKAESPELALDWEETELLWREGFALPRLIEERERRQATWRGTLNEARFPRALYSPLSQAPFETQPKMAWVIEAPSVRPPSPNYSARLPDRTFSATQLETYARCPSQYFFSHALRLNKQRSWEEQYALLFGSAVHLALENFFAVQTEIVDSDSSRSALRTVFVEALTSLAPTLLETESWHVFLTEQFDAMVPHVFLLEQDLRRLLPGSRITGRELPFEFGWQGIRLRGKIDRVDESASGELLLLDYKTGNVGFSPNHVNDGSHFQALVYLMAAEDQWKKPLLGMLFYDLKKGELKRGLLRKEEAPVFAKALTRGHALSPEAWDALMETGRTQMEQLAFRIREGNFEPLPDNATCDVCDWTEHCRQAAGYAER